MEQCLIGSPLCSVLNFYFLVQEREPGLGKRVPLSATIIISMGQLLPLEVPLRYVLVYI